MAHIWIISDTHFNHEKILDFKNDEGQPVRPFDSVLEMNETMIDNWNSVVTPQDKVYHLGDVLFGLDKDKWLNENFKRLNGKKRLVVGNHDNIKVLAPHFQRVSMWRNFSEFGLLLTHVPVHQSTVKEKHRFGPGSMVNVHGHIHQRSSPEGPYKCVCVEHTNYTPVNIEDLRTN